MSAPVLFPHIGDVHLQHTSPRNADRLASLDQILDECLGLARLGAWLIPGDLFHQKSAVEDRNALAARLLRMIEVAPVCLVRGNHDAIGDLDIFAKLRGRWPVYVWTTPEVRDIPLPTGDIAAIAGVPYPDKSLLVARGTAKADVVQDGKQLLDAIFMQLAHELSDARAAGAIPICIAHANIGGAIASTGQPQIGQEIEVDTVMLQRLPAIYCGFSHIHKPQIVGAGVFAGSIAAMDYGEAEPKSYVVLTATRDGATWRGHFERLPLRTPRMYHVDGEWANGAFVWHLRGEAAPRDGAPIDWTGGDVRVRYRVKASERALVDDARIRADFAGALRLKLEPVAVPDRDVRAPDVAAARTIHDKVAAFMKVATLGDGLMDKIAALERGDGDAVLAEVLQHIAQIETREEASAAA